VTHVVVDRSGALVTGPSSLRRHIPCDRCGVEHMYHSGRATNLCRDCVTTLTFKEREAWK